MRVIYHQDAGPALRARLAALEDSGLEVAVCGELDDSRLADLLPEAEVLWHCLRPVDAALLAAAPSLRLIQKIGVGVNTIDLDTARARGIPVCNMPGTNAVAVAEATLALMLAVLRSITRFDGLTRAGDGWRWAPALQDGLGEIRGRRIGLVGHGGVPRALAPILLAMGADLAYTATAPKPDLPYPFLPMDALLERSDIVSLHVPLTDATRNLIGADELQRLGPTGILVNTARGGLVDQAALTRALREGRLGGAGLDVFAAEPIGADEPLLELDNLVVTPHVAWLTQETLARSIAVAADNCRRLNEGAELLHRVV